MPPEPLPFDRKVFFKERKPSSSDPVGTVPPRWTNHNNHGSSSSCRGGAAAGPSDFRRPFSGHGKPVGGGSHVTTVKAGQHDKNNCRNESSKENNTNNGRVSVALGSQKDMKGGNSSETTASPNGNSHSLSDSANSWEQLQSKDQWTKNNGGEFRTTGRQKVEKENSLGSSLDWKSLKWIRSGSLSSRGSGFSHSSSCKIIGVDSFDTKIEAPLGNSSPSGNFVPCVIPWTPDEASSQKKPRLGWGEGLAKYEKKTVGPDDNVDKKAEARNGMVDGVSSSEPLLPSPNLPDKSSSLTGCSESASPTTPYSFACSSSPGLEEKESIKAATMDHYSFNPSVASCPLSQNHTEGSAFNLENLELTEGFNLSSSIDELLQSDDSSALGSGFVRSTAMDKLQVCKAEMTRILEITESEIDSLECELKSLISDGGSCPFPAASNENAVERRGPLPLEIISSGHMTMEKADGPLEESNGVEDVNRETPGTASSRLVEQRVSPLNLDIRFEKDKCSPRHASDDISGSKDFIGGDEHYGRECKLYDLILASNKDLANRASDEFSKMLPTTHLCTPGRKVSVSNESLIKKRVATRKRFKKFKERVITLKFQAVKYAWKEDLRLLSLGRFGAKSQKKFELSTCVGYADHQKLNFSEHSRLLSAWSLSLVPTTEIVDYVNRLLSDSWVRIYRNELKMPSLMLDKRERIASKFISDNGLVENPIEVEKERSIGNSWTTGESEIFLDKYYLFGKNFRKIASFLEHKTIADCVEFYYKNHKSDRFQKTKKDLECAKGKSSTTNTYLVTSGKRSNRETTAASAVVSNDGMFHRQQKCTLGTTNDLKRHIDGSISERLNNFYNEQDTAAADVLAGISVSSEALSSCITSSVDLGRRCEKLYSSSKRPLEDMLHDVDEETCSDDSCSEEMDPCDWTDEEKSSLIQAVRTYGKDFSMISRHMGARSKDECRVFFSKARRCLGLDVIHLEPGTTGGGGSVISHDLRGERCSNGNLEGAADSEAIEAEKSPQKTNSEGSAGEMNSASGAKFEFEVGVNGNGRRVRGSYLEDGLERVGNLFKRAGEDDVSSGRKRLSQDNGYDLHLSNHHCLADCEESSVKGKNFQFLMDPFLAAQEERHGSSSKPKNGGVKLFGQILSNRLDNYCLGEEKRRGKSGSEEVVKLKSGEMGRVEW